MRWTCKCGHENIAPENHYPTHCQDCGKYWGDGMVGTLRENNMGEQGDDEGGNGSDGA